MSKAEWRENLKVGSHVLRTSASALLCRRSLLKVRDKTGRGRWRTDAAKHHNGAKYPTPLEIGWRRKVCRDGGEEHENVLHAQNTFPQSVRR